jgi:hypothetical protein
VHAPHLHVKDEAARRAQGVHHLEAPPAVARVAHLKGLRPSEGAHRDAEGRRQHGHCSVCPGADHERRLAVLDRGLQVNDDHARGLARPVPRRRHLHRRPEANGEPVGLRAELGVLLCEVKVPLGQVVLPVNSRMWRVNDEA